MSEEERRQLQQQLWNIANTLRGKMGADEFRDYILGFIFYKYLSEKIQRFADIELKQENLNFVDIDENSQDGKKYIAALSKAALSELGYFLKPSELFHAIAMKGSNQKDSNNEGESHNFILDDLTKILKNIEQSTLGTDSADDFVNLFEDLDLTSSKLGKSEKEKNDLVAKVLVHLDKIDFDLSNKTGDVLGDAYEYLIGEFASGAGKKAGEFYTPQPASSLLAKLVTAINKNIKSAYDPTCGSGSLLLRVKREANKVGKIYGQELNRTTYNLARMNMILHDVHFADFDIRQEDTLEHPQHRDLKFDVIVANPPFSAQWSASQLHMSDDRFSAYGKLAPSSKADMAFVQHMIYHLDDEGTMAVLLPHGVLFRGGAEGHIRQYLIEQMNCLDAVIGLPANMFYGTSIPTCVLVFKKCRKNSDDVLFIDASQHFEKVKTSNVMRPEHIEKIVNAYKARTNEDKYSFVASMDEIKANDYNLNIPRYVDTFVADDAIDLDAISAQLIELDKASHATDVSIAAFCKELGIKPPFAVRGVAA
jgi:type I restriction enzyme M protein